MSGAVNQVGPYRVRQRVGPTVWKAEDSRSGKAVALKILTKQLVRDPSKREALLTQLQASTVMTHPFLVPILEVMAVQENLLLVMEYLEAVGMSRRVNGTPMARAEFFRLSYELLDALKFLHDQHRIHANINGDSVMVTTSGQIRLGGFNLLNLVPADKAAVFQQKGNDVRSVAYMAPEQIIAQAPPDTRTDIYSAGVVMYEMSTGKLPHVASTAADFARSIMEGQPASPRTVNPKIETSILNLLGRCLFKEPARREKEVKGLLDLIAQSEPGAVRQAQELSFKTMAAPLAGGPAREAILLVSDVAHHDEMARTDPERAVRAAARMQQLLGEAVYLFDGQVVDPFGKRCVAELPSVEAALEAARKAEFDFSPEQQQDPIIPVRMLLHAGAVTSSDVAISGEAVNRAAEILEHLPPLQLHLTEDFLRKGRGSVRVKDAGARAGTRLYTIVAAEPVVQSAVNRTELAGDAPETLLLEDLAPVPAPSPPRKKLVFAVAAIALLVVLGAAAAYLFTRDTAGDRVAEGPATTAPAERQPQRVFISGISVEGADDGQLAARATAARLAAVEILKSVPSVRLADSAGEGVTSISASLRTGPNGPEIIPAAPGSAFAPIAAPDTASAVQALLTSVSQQTRQNLRVTESAEALNAYGEAVTATAANELSRAEPAVAAAIAADPRFMAAQLLAMRYYQSVGKTKEAAQAARTVYALDPSNLDAARTAARMLLAAGELGPAFQTYGAILRADASDAEALAHIARYAASSGDGEHFTTAVTRLNALAPESAPVHAPDILLATGKMEDAIQRYYDIEVNAPQNAALALKIGKISVLRRAESIAELELKKLQSLDPSYGYHILNAYMAASKNDRATAEQELKLAEAGSKPGDDYWTSAAEVYAMLGGTTDVIEALSKAAARKEPTASYILSNPLFHYLRSQRSFVSLRGSFAAQQNEVRSALAQVPL